MKLERILPTTEHFNILYQQLKKRKHVISHKKIPNYKNHKLFVKIILTEYGILLEERV